MNFPSDWPLVRLATVIVDMQPGFAQRPNADKIGTPQLRTNNVSTDGNIDLSEVKYVRAASDDLEKYGVKKGDVIFNNTNSPDLVGKTAYFDLDQVFVLSNHMTRIRVDRQILDAEFLARYLHYLWKIGLTRRWSKQWVNQAAVDQVGLSQFQIPLPPLPEQRRLAAILRQADELRRKRRAANEKAQGLLQALFYEMFGDPATNPKGWMIVRFDDVLSQEENALMRGPFGGTIKKEIFVPDGYKVYEQKNAISEDFDIGTYFIEKDKYQELRSFSIQPGDLIVSCSGTIGKIAIVPDNARQGIINQALMKIRLDQSKALPVFFKQLLETSYLQNDLFGSAVGSAIKNVKPLRQIRATRIPLPPHPLQRDFALRAAEIKTIVQKQSQSQQSCDALFGSLLFQAFTGELTAAWREQHRVELAQAAEEMRQRLAERKRPAEPVRVEIVDEKSLQESLSQFNAVAQTLAAQVVTPEFTRLADALKPYTASLAESLNAALQQRIAELGSPVSDMLANAMSPLIASLRQQSQFYYADWLAKIAQSAQLQQRQPLTRAELQTTIAQVIEQLPPYWTLIDLAEDWRVNHLPRNTVREIVDLMVVMGTLRETTIRHETEDPQQPVQFIRAYARVSEAERVAANEIQL